MRLLWEVVFSMLSGGKGKLDFECGFFGSGNQVSLGEEAISKSGLVEGVDYYVERGGLFVSLSSFVGGEPLKG